MASIWPWYVQVIVKDNVMRFTGGKGAVTEQRQVVPSGKDEALAVQKDEALQISQPAIFNAVTPKTRAENAWSS